MAFFKLTKSAQELKKSAFEYLDKERDELTKLEIAMNKIKSNINRSDENERDKFEEEYKRLKRDYAIKRQIWEKSEGHGFNMSGFIRTNLYKDGFGKIEERQERYNVVIKEWNSHLNKMKEEGRVKNKHVGVRRFVLAPSLKEIKQILGKEYDSFVKENSDEGIMFGDRDTLYKIMDDTIRDTMKKLKERYVSKGDQISYVYSMHFDTNVPHAHIYLCPYTKKGEYLSLNSGKFYSKDNQMHERENERKKPEDKLRVIKQMAKNSFGKSVEKQTKMGIDQDISNQAVEAIKKRMSLNKEKGLDLEL